MSWPVKSLSQYTSNISQQMAEENQYDSNFSGFLQKKKPKTFLFTKLFPEF